jgi:hypothetical protein
MVEQPLVPPGAVACWQAMTRLNITTRVDAIEYLRSAEPAARLSVEEMRELLCVFPVLPARSDHARVNTMPDAWERDPGGGRRSRSAPVGPDVLAYAASILPAVAGARPGSVDVHQVLFEALRRLGVGADRYDRLRLAEEARDMLAAYLVAVGQAQPKPRPSAAVRGWVVFQDIRGVQLALAGAAGYWRAELAWD